MYNLFSYWFEFPQLNQLSLREPFMEFEYIKPNNNNKIPIFILILILISLQSYAAKNPDSQQLLDNVNNKYYYYTRTRGLFRICYPKERPPASAGK